MLQCVRNPNKFGGIEKAFKLKIGCADLIHLELLWDWACTGRETCDRQLPDHGNVLEFVTRLKVITVQIHVLSMGQVNKFEGTCHILVYRCTEYPLLDIANIESAPAC